MENDRLPVPMTTIGGFLGAGKTTLLNHILHGDHGLKIAALVNDFGAINIDAQLVVGVEGETVNLSNGCICCTIRGDLLKAALELLQREDAPEYIIVETSGVSDPIAVANVFLAPEIRALVRLDGILVVVDADNVLTLDEENAGLALDQIAVADIVVLNKVDLVTAETLEAIKRNLGRRIAARMKKRKVSLDAVEFKTDLIRPDAPEVRVLETTYGRVPLALVLGVRAGMRRSGCTGAPRGTYTCTAWTGKAITIMGMGITMTTMGQNITTMKIPTIRWYSARGVGRRTGRFR